MQREDAQEMMYGCSLGASGWSTILRALARAKGANVDTFAASVRGEAPTVGRRVQMQDMATCAEALAEMYEGALPAEYADFRGAVAQRVVEIYALTVLAAASRHADEKPVPEVASIMDRALDMLGLLGDMPYIDIPWLGSAPALPVLPNAVPVMKLHRLLALLDRLRGDGYKLDAHDVYNMIQDAQVAPAFVAACPAEIPDGWDWIEEAGGLAGWLRGKPAFIREFRPGEWRIHEGYRTGGFSTRPVSGTVADAVGEAARLDGRA